LILSAQIRNNKQHPNPATQRPPCAEQKRENIDLLRISQKSHSFEASLSLLEATAAAAGPKSLADFRLQLAPVAKWSERLSDVDRPCFYCPK
jgi:hypothetical protein